MRCKFGDSFYVDAYHLSRNLIECVTPDVKYPQWSRLFVGYRNGPYYHTGYNFHFHIPCKIRDIFPSTGSTSGGTKVRVRGNFPLNNTLSCRFGSIDVSATLINNHLVSCLSPTSQHGEVKFEVLVNGNRNGIRDNEIESIKFNYFQTPTLIRIIPNNAPIGEWVNISISGTNFIRENRLKCRIGNLMIPADFHSDNDISCNIPPHRTPTTVEVRVTVNGLDFIQNKMYFHFLPDANVTKVFPSYVIHGVMSSLLVTGNNFVESRFLQCHFGKKYPSTFARLISKDNIQCETPQFNNRSSDENIFVSISNNGGFHFSSSFAVLTVFRKPRIQSTIQFQDNGFSLGGTSLRLMIQGINTNASTACRFGEINVPASIKLIKSTYLMRCVSPPHLPGRVNVHFVNGNEFLYIGDFSFVTPPVIIGMYPSHGKNSGGTLIRLEGNDLEHTKHCRFSSTSSSVQGITVNTESVTVSASVMKNSSIVCVSPSGFPSASVNIEVTCNGQDFLRTGHIFSFQKIPNIISVTPKLGPQNGNTRVIIEVDMILDAIIMCRFGSIPSVQAHLISFSKVSCVTPPSPEIGITSLFVTSNGLEYSNMSEAGKFEFYATPVIMNIIHPFGTVNTVNYVEIKATNMQPFPYIGCRFGLKYVFAEFVNINTLSCYTPLVPVEGLSSFSISFNGQDFHGSNNTYEFVKQPKVISISPSRGITSGGTSVTLHTERLHTSVPLYLFCAFGKVSKKAILVSIDHVRCITPPINHNAEVLVSLFYEQSVGTEKRIDNYIEAVGGSTFFTYTESIIIVSIQPSVGTINGGSPITIFGLNIPNIQKLVCQFGSVYSEALMVSDQKIKCLAPPQNKTGVMRVKIGSKCGSVETSKSGDFEYIFQPSIFDIFPKIGTSLGGTTVVIVGNMFPSSPRIHSTFCRFGEFLTSQAQVISSTKVKCNTPAPDTSMALGKSVKISITFNGVDYHVGSERYTYVPQLYLLSVEPRSGPSSGGTPVNIFLSSEINIYTDVNCHFGSEIVEGKVVAEERGIVGSFQVQCISPPSLLEGKVALEISVHSGNDRSLSTKLFQYYVQPHITHIHPKSGFYNGGGNVVVKGRGFLDNTDISCLFGLHKSPRVTWVTGQEIICTSPVIEDPSSESVTLAFPVLVSNNGIDFSSSTNKSFTYQYYSKPAASSVTPQNVSPTGETICVIKGKDLHEAESCRFGAFGKSVPVISWDQSSISCSPSPIQLLSPYLKSPAEVYISFHGKFISMGIYVYYIPIESPQIFYERTLEDTFIYPTLTKTVPSSTSGGQWINIFGSGFINRDGLCCIFGGDILSDARYISSNKIRCLIPKIIPGKYH